MKAYQLHAYDGPSGLSLSEVGDPQPGADDLVVQVEAIGVNFPDLLMTRGEYQVKNELPIIPGCELAGTVLRSPPTSRWSPGDRVTAFVWSGAFAEQALVPIETAVRVPDSMSLTTAASMMVNYQTTLFALERRAVLREGEHVLVLGAAGGIGSAAAQVARGLGARVVAGVADQEQAEFAEAAGAEHILILEPGYAPKIRDLLGRGVDLVVDPLGDWLFDEAVRCLEPEGRVVVLGFAGGRIPRLALNRLLLRNISVVGAAFGAFLDLDPGLAGRQGRHIAEMVDSGVIKPQRVVTAPFAHLPSALNDLGLGKIRGKAVVTFD